MRFLLIDADAESETSIRKCVAESSGLSMELSRGCQKPSASDRRNLDAVVLGWEPESEQASSKLSAVVRRYSHLPVIALSAREPDGKSGVEAAIAAIRLGAQDCLLAQRLTGELISHSIRCAVERRRVEQCRMLASALEREQHFRDLFDNAAIGMDLSEATPRACILQSNWALEEMLGYARHELKGKRVSHITHPDDAERDQFLYRDLIAGERASYQVEKRYVRKDGRVVWGQTSVSLIRDVSGRPLYTIAVVADITERIEAESAIRRLAREIIDLPLEERRRIGQELHDGLGQELTGLSLLAKGVAGDFETHNLPHADIVQQLSAAIQQMICRVRSISRGLVPVEVDSEGLMAALGELASATRERTGIACSFRCAQPVHILDKHVAHHVYRIVQEAVANAVKHGAAKQIMIHLGIDEEQIEVSVKNNGQPFPSSGSTRGGLGLDIMRYRANLIGAVLCIQPEEAGRGTVVTCKLRKDD